MAVNVGAVINPDHLEGGDGTVRVALLLWSSRNGPIKYNDWQSLFFRLIREGYVDADCAEGESLAQRQARIRELYEDIQTELHGPDHKIWAVRTAVRARTAAIMQDRRERLSAEPVGQHSYSTLQRVRLEDAQRMRAEGTTGTGPGVTSVAGHAPSGVRITSGPDSETSENHYIGTPRGPRDRVPSVSSPDHLFYGEAAQKVWEEEEATHTECTDEQDERLAKMVRKLNVLDGSTPEGIEFLLRVEQLVKDYKEEYSEWLVTQPEGAQPLVMFALEKLTSIQADDFTEEEDLMQHVYALGKLSNRTVQQGRNLCKSLWENSRHTTPEPQGNRVAATPGIGRQPGPPSMSSPEIQRQGSPGGGSTVDVVRAMTDMSDQFRGALEAVVDKFTAMNKDGEPKEEGEVYRSEKLQAISGLDFKRPLPQISDSDPDLDKYDLEFDLAVECYSYGGRPLREIDKLWLYSYGFKEGGTRKTVYKNMMRRANRQKRLPQDAAKVHAEIRVELRTYIYETIMQKRIRLDKAFATVQQGGLSHANFRATFDNLLQDMEDSGMDMPTEETLHRNYLTKLRSELRIKVMSKEWKIDGQDKPARNATTYKEVAIACGLCLEETADIYATGHAGSDSFMMLESGGTQFPNLASGGGGAGGAQNAAVCSYCMGGHNTVLCAQKAADTRQMSNGTGSEGDFWRKKYEEQGATCNECNKPGHAGKHHLLAAQDYAASKGGGSGGGQNARPKGKASPSPTGGKFGEPCKGGANCRYFLQHGECKNKHTKEELKSLRDKYKAKQLSKAPSGGGGGGSGKTCTCCGKANHVKADCKLKDKECNKCGKVGHIAAVCRSGGAGGGGKGGGKGTKGGGKGDRKGSYAARDGDWTCLQCNTPGNFASRTECFKCKAAKGLVMAIGDGAPPVQGPRAKAKAKQLALASGGADGQYCIGEEIRSMSDQFVHHGSKVARVPDTMEMGDYFGLTDSQESSCYLMDVTCNLEATDLQKPDTTFADLADRMMLLNPEFAAITRLADMVKPEGEPDENFKTRQFQRPVGYSAMTRLHVGRMCVPMLNDTGATCSCMTEEQVVLLLNHTQKMLAEGKISKTDYNYPIVQLYRYKNPAVLRGAEKTGVMPVEFAIVLRCEFIPDGSVRGPTKEIYFKIFKAGTCAVVGGVMGYPSLDHAVVPGGEGLGWINGAEGHHYAGLGVTIPRLDDQRKANYHSNVTRYAESHGQLMCIDDVTGESVNYIGLEAAREFRAAALAVSNIPEGVMEPIGLDTVLLSPGERAVVPIKWDRKTSLACELSTHPEAPAGLTVLPGTFDFKETMSVVVENESTLPVQLVEGKPLVVGAKEEDVPELESCAAIQAQRQKFHSLIDWQGGGKDTVKTVPCPREDRVIVLVIHYVPRFAACGVVE